MTRRLAVIGFSTLAALAVASPAMAFQHDRVHNAALHIFLDVASLLIVVSPVIAALTWGRGQSKWLLAALIGLVQVPVAVLAFVPAASHAMKGTGLTVGLLLTALAIFYTRRLAHLRETSQVQQEGTT
ncbi:hypothetical protein [Haloglycomyces albus]|uniref:hypothetical protein n=1 Tax=Haloglycomyces albus TaxID=526067 RepID=UPI00046CE8AC|nr:hypothetical protein [Haloglycomyces albus]